MFVCQNKCLCFSVCVVMIAGEVIRPVLKHGSASFAKQGQLVISPVTFSSAGEYECFTNGTDVEIMGKYSVRVMGETYLCFTNYSYNIL